MKLAVRGFVATALTCLLAVSMHAQAAPATVIPVEAELLTRMDARNLKASTLVYARLATNWSGPGCTMARGATLEARVVSVTPHSKLSSESDIALAFEKAQCGKSELERFDLLLAAVAAPPDDDAGAVSTDLPAALGGGPTPGNSVAAPNSTNSFRSADQQVDPLLVNLHRFPVSAKLRAGDVLGIRGVTLRVGDGPEGSSVLTSKGRNVQLERNTRLLLMASSVATAGSRAEARTSATGSAVPQPAARTVQLVMRPVSTAEDEAAADADSCVPPACNIAASSDDAVETGPSASIALASLGYAPRVQQEVEAPGTDEALAYLSPTELLVAFNPHTLVPRFGSDREGSTVRVIRAALVDVAQGKVVRTIDWHMRDDRQYLWQVARHRVLVHAGGELRVYGPGLKVEARMALTSPLAFVRCSPDGKIIAVGVIKERHTQELHARLLASLDEEPEEDVEILIMNEEFETLASVTSTSDRLPPTILNEGQLKLLLQASQSASGERWYRLLLKTWDNSSRTMARVSSACIPTLSSISPDLTLLVTCSMTNSAREYRVMRADGKLVLRGQSTLNKLGHAALGDEEAKEFAVRIFAASEPVLPGEVFHSDILQSADLAVYASEDGRQLFNVRVRDPAVCSGGYALAPGGRQLAVLTRDHIALFTMPARDAAAAQNR